MARLLCVIVEDSALCEYVLKKIKRKLSPTEYEEIEVLLFEEFVEKYSPLKNHLEGFPQFFLVDDKNELIDTVIGGDPESLEKVVDIVKNKL